MSIVQELKRRNVIRVAVAYVVAAWVIIEVSSLILEIYESPGSVIRIIVALLSLGLPFAMVFAWAFEVTPEGIKRDSEVDRSRSITHVTAKRLDMVTIALVVVAIGLFSVDRFLPNRFREATVDDGIKSQAVWAVQQLLEIDRLRDLGQNRAAFDLAREVAPLLPEESVPDYLWEGYSWSSDINTEPSGARVYRQPINAPEDQWEDLGTTPLKAVRFAEGEGYRLRFELEGHRYVELLQTAVRGYWSLPPMNPVKLDPAEVLPDKMVRIPGFTHDLVEYDDYFMDRFELTNREYAEFVRAGGYQTRQFWNQLFIKDGREISWEDAISEFTDRTGRTGPSTWTGGAYPDGFGDHPVGGVSWYEAAAYANFANKALPTHMHYQMARRFYRDNSWLIASRSNIGRDSPRPVGTNRAMNTLGIYDLDGNVREWGWNKAGKDTRGTYGGAWSDAVYHAEDVIPKPPWDRDATNGIRLIHTFDSEEKLARLQEPSKSTVRRNFYEESPVSDAEFAIYRRLYSYDSVPLDARVVQIDDFEHWTRERAEFDLPSGDRGAAILYVPKNVDPPYVTVMYWPGSDVLFLHSVNETRVSPFDFILRSGRVIVLPVLKSTLDRDDSDFSTVEENLWSTPEMTATNRYRELQLIWMQEFSRTIDYLETRKDIVSDKLGFYGFSWGGGVGPIVLALEGERIDAAVLNVGGLDDIGHYLPEVDTFNFVTRVYVPVLMINGEYDTDFPFETSQKPMFELLSTAPEHKKLYVTPAAHIVPRDVLIRESLNWFDRYLRGNED
jgi:hypothetical protein